MIVKAANCPTKPVNCHMHLLCVVCCFDFLCCVVCIFL